MSRKRHWQPIRAITIARRMFEKGAASIPAVRNFDEAEHITALPPICQEKKKSLA